MSDTKQGDPIRELRLRYTVEGMTRIIEWIDHMNLGELPDFMVENWHPMDSSEG